MAKRRSHFFKTHDRYIIKKNQDTNLFMVNLTYEIRAVNNIPLVCLKSDIFAPSSRRMSSSHHVVDVAHDAAAAGKLRALAAKMGAAFRGNGLSWKRLVAPPVRVAARAVHCTCV